MTKQQKPQLSHYSWFIHYIPLQSSLLLCVSQEADLSTWHKRISFPPGFQFNYKEAS